MSDSVDPENMVSTGGAGGIMLMLGRRERLELCVGESVLRE